MPLPCPYKIQRDFDLSREKITAKQAALVIDYLLSTIDYFLRPVGHSRHPTKLLIDPSARLRLGRDDKTRIFICWPLSFTIYDLLLIIVPAYAGITSGESRWNFKT